MELGTDIPLLVGYLHNFHKSGSGVDAYATHASRLERLLILAVELIPMTMSLANNQIGRASCRERVCSWV